MVVDQAVVKNNGSGLFSLYLPFRPIITMLGEGLAEILNPRLLER